MVFAEFDMSSLSFEVRDHPRRGATLVSFIRRTSWPRIDTPQSFSHCLAAPKGFRAPHPTHRATLDPSQPYSADFLVGSRPTSGTPGGAGEYQPGTSSA